MKDIQPLAGGLGSWLSDTIPFMPSGHRRAGAARLMASRMEDPRLRSVSYMNRHPVWFDVLRTAMLALPAAAGRPVSGLVAYGLLTGIKRAELNAIQERYAKQKRRRLRELGTMDEAIGSNWNTGTTRLGAAQAYEAMRDRKWKDLPAMNEAADAMALSSMGATYPLTSLLDLYTLHATRRNDKNAAVNGGEEKDPTVENEKDISFHDQRRNRVLPYMLLAGLGTTLGQLQASNLVVRAIDQQADKLKLDADAYNRPGQRSTHPLVADSFRNALVKHVSGKSPMVGDINRYNSFFWKPDAQDLAYDWDLFIQNMADNNGLRLNDPAQRKRVLDQGVIGLGYGGFKSPAILAHEAGHAKIEHTPGLLRWLQRNMYGRDALLTPLASAGSLAAGLASKNPLLGGLYGLGIGGLTGIGTIVPEAMASVHGLRGLDTFDAKGLDLGKNNKDLLTKAFLTYAAARLLLPTLAGAAGGWIGQRRKREKEKAQANEEAQGKIIRFPRPEERRKAAFALDDLWRVV